MLNAMRLFDEVGYDGPSVYDHVPETVGDSERQEQADALTPWYVKGLIRSACVESSTTKRSVTKVGTSLGEAAHDLSKLSAGRPSGPPRGRWRMRQRQLTSDGWDGSADDSESLLQRLSRDRLPSAARPGRLGEPAIAPDRAESGSAVLGLPHP